MFSIFLFSVISCCPSGSVAQVGFVLQQHLDPEELLALVFHVRITTTIGICGQEIGDEKSLMNETDQSEVLFNCLWRRDFEHTVKRLVEQSKKKLKFKMLAFWDPYFSQNIVLVL